MTKTNKRKVDIVVISDTHLGTYGCHAKELLHYLKSIKPKVVVLNGDIIDIWQFNKRYWPKSHMKVVKHLLGLLSKGTPIYYITGNHDELLRKFSGFHIGSFCIVNKLLLPLQNDEKAWIFHGDVFDVTMQHSKWIAKAGAVGYDSLILLNRFINFISVKILKRGKISLSKKIKNSVKKAISYIQDFEQTASDIAIHNNYDYVICGHIHQPKMKRVETSKGSITYLNSGDWIENLTALEYHQGNWSIYYYEDQGPELSKIEISEEESLDSSQLFDNLLKEFEQMKNL